jgi:phosphoenolpyruvate carboxylase
MNSRRSAALEEFQKHVALPFQLYNSLFTSLPFNRIEKTGILLSLFLTNCEDGYGRDKSPTEIIEDFFRDHAPVKTESEKVDLLFRFVQYAERQVVLFDALEDAAFSTVNDLQGGGTLKHLETTAQQDNKRDELCKKLQEFSVRLVLTAHPTQFYPGAVLGIINDLVKAIGENDVSDINTYLQQLGRTPFIKKQKPTPLDEVVSLIWYLENVFYDAFGEILSEINGFCEEAGSPVRMGFWPGGDRDGNPFVTCETTMRTAAALSDAILRCYYRDIRQLKRRLTFSGVEPIIAELEQKLRDSTSDAKNTSKLTKAEILAPLLEIRGLLLDRHNGLFVDLVNELIYKVELFGTHFATLDVRQESSIHAHIVQKIAALSVGIPENYPEVTDDKKIAVLSAIKEGVNPDEFGDDELAADTLKTIAAIRTIQQQNGEDACHRYIISQCRSALNVFEVYGLFLAAGWKADEMVIDIVPLFETIKDLESACGIMRRLYEERIYRDHLSRRKNTQTIMLGFSDGTKDGGYLAANWSIFRAKKQLSEVSRQFGIDVIFFDGRGGPPARGGGKTHMFYSSMGREISNRAIELTVQGQTVSSNFGTVEAARYNIDQLIHAGLHKELFSDPKTTFTAEEEALMNELSAESYRVYEELKNDPLFLDYLTNVSPLRYYAETNIGSRPTRRGGSGKMELNDLRAIPFVGAWSQLKQNIPGFYGVGSALEKLERDGKLEAVRSIFQSNAFFKALTDNCEMAMQKCFFPLTQFLADDDKYGSFWRKLWDEFELTKGYLLLISDKDEMMEDYQVEKLSIQMRERIMLPLTTIQQYSLAQLRGTGSLDAEKKASYEKLVVRCSFGIINAGRNSA